MQLSSAEISGKKLLQYYIRGGDGIVYRIDEYVDRYDTYKMAETSDKLNGLFGGFFKFVGRIFKGILKFASIAAPILQFIPGVNASVLLATRMLSQANMIYGLLKTNQQQMTKVMIPNFVDLPPVQQADLLQMQKDYIQNTLKSGERIAPVRG